MPLVLKAKNDGTLYEIPDGEREEALATGKFTEHYRMKAKNDGKEYLIPAEEMGDALKTDKFELSEVYNQRKNIEANPTQPKMGKAASFALGAGNAMSLGFADEIIGGLGGDKTDVRKTQKAADDQNPGSYLLGGLAGGAVSPSIVGSAGKTMVTAIGKGALAGGVLGGIQGIGENTKSDNLGADALKGAAVGSITGGIGGGLGRLATGFTKAGREDLGQEFKAFKQGVSDSKPDVFTGANQAIKLWDGVKETLNSSAAQQEFFDFVKNSKTNTISRMVREGSIPPNQEKVYLNALDKLSDEEYILMKLQEGDEEVSGWIAKQSGGNVAEKQKFLAMSPEKRQSLRSLDMNQEAKELSPLVSPAKEAIFKDAGDKFNVAREDAAKNFDPTIGNVVDAANKTAENFTNMGEVAGGGTKGYFNQVQKIINEGVGEVDRGFSKGKGYGEVSAAEQYERLKSAREILDSGINWSSSKNQSPMGEKFLKDYRQAIDKALKELPSQGEADKAYSIAKNLDDMIFKNAELGGEVDPYKLKRAFGNTDQANRLRDGLSQLKDFANNSNDPEVKRTSQAFLDKFNQIFDTKKSSDSLNQLQREGGPSALQIQRLDRSLKGDTSVTKQAVKQTADFLLDNESTTSFLQDSIGKAYKDMSVKEKMAFTRIYLKLKQQGGIGSPEAIKHNFEVELNRIK